MADTREATRSDIMSLVCDVAWLHGAHHPHGTMKDCEYATCQHAASFLPSQNAARISDNGGEGT